jgi:hypothetical protein
VTRREMYSKYKRKLKAVGSKGKEIDRRESIKNSFMMLTTVKMMINGQQQRI